MDTRTRRWLIPLAAALAVLAVLAVLWIQRPGGPGLGASGGDGGTVGFGGAGPTDNASSVPGSPGTGAPGSAGSPGLPDDDLTPVPGPDQPPAPNTQAIEGYFPRDDTRLALNYVTGVPECYGEVGDPVVEETADAVVVTLPKRLPKNDEDVACIDIALNESVNITLDAPLGDREVRDGSRGDAVVDRADAPYGKGEPAY